MADQNNYFSSMVNSLMESTGAVLTSRTVVGDPVIVGDTTIIPLSDVTIGCGAGANTDEKKEQAVEAFQLRCRQTLFL